MRKLNSANCCCVSSEDSRLSLHGGPCVNESVSNASNAANLLTFTRGTHNRTVLSEEPDATMVPFGEKFTQRTGPCACENRMSQDCRTQNIQSFLVCSSARLLVATENSATSELWARRGHISSGS